MPSLCRNHSWKTEVLMITLTAYGTALHPTLSVIFHAKPITLTYRRKLMGLTPSLWKCQSLMVDSLHSRRYSCMNNLTR